MSNRPHERNPNMWWMVLLLALFCGVLWVLFFGRVDPAAWGIPFFFWYQFPWVVISALVTALVYFKATPQFQPIRRKQPERYRK
jgi:hypothetical protein